MLMYNQANVTTIKNFIKNRIYRTGAMTFAELVKFYPGDLTGTENIEIERYKIVLWQNVSEDLKQALNELQEEYAVKYVPCDMILYILDGMTLDIDIVKSIPAGGYKESRWLPVQMVLRR